VPHVTQRFLLARFAAMLTGCLIVVGALRVVLPLAEQVPNDLAQFFAGFGHHPAAFG
jgi:hypothetical protein